MAKRRDKGFQWVREDQEEEARPRVERAVRQREKDETRALELWVRRLAEVPRGRWSTLGLSDDVLRALAQYADMSRTPARGRIARRIKQLLRHEDLEAVEAALAGDSEQDQHLRALERWRDRLVAGDDSDLQAFMESYPRTNRQQLRSLLRQAQGEGKAAAKALRAVFQELKAASA